MVAWSDLETAFAQTGLILRGGFLTVLTDLDGWLPLSDQEYDPQSDKQTRSLQRGTVALVGNAGADFWASFSIAHTARFRDTTNPLDDFTKSIVRPIAVSLGAHPVFPSDLPYAPFQRWAMRAEPVAPSPLGILLHPRFGLWHAYRAALVFPSEVEGCPGRENHPHPCDACADKPCLSACPAGAFGGNAAETDIALNVAACAGHLASRADPDCMTLGCRARDACPVGTQWRYDAAQVRFHMKSFARARGIPEANIPSE